MIIHEDLLHYVWKVKSFELSNLFTSCGKSLEILHFGTYNQDAGPDFIEAKVRINNTLWVGHIEMHVNSSDWLKHKHDNDPNYQNVILHVVLEDDVSILREDGTRLPCLVLKSRMPKNVISSYRQLRQVAQKIPCEKLITRLPEITINKQVERSAIHRLERKANELIKDLDDLNQDVLELIYQRVAYSFGLRVNAESMRILVKSISSKLLGKHRSNLFQLEALLFGQSGLLHPRLIDGYPLSLQKEYSILKAKYNLESLSPTLWKFSRMRPSSFPTIRIAQFAQLVFNEFRLDYWLFERDNESIWDVMDIQLDEYWSTHYRFDSESKTRIKRIGEQTKQLVVINAISPILFMYGMIKKSAHHKDRALELLETCTVENNQITRMWKTLGVRASNALDSQGLIELKSNMCDNFRCLNCAIGHSVISPDDSK